MQQHREMTMNLPDTLPLTRWQTVRQTLRRVAALVAPYFSSDEKWRARLMLIAIVVLNLAAVYMLVLLNEWNRVFYDALQNKDAPIFWAQIWRFCYLAVAFIIIAVYKFYLTQLLDMRWRAWMTRHYLQRWLTGQAFYQLELARFSDAAANTDNPDQRIQEDIKQFTSETIGLSRDLLNSTVTLISFVGILWSLSGGFSFQLGGHNFVIAGFMVWMALLYCLAGSLITHFIGRPQIRLNFQQQKLEADFRHHLVRVREYSEAIALDQGQEVEKTHLGGRFASVLANYFKLIKAQKNLIWFSTFFDQAATVFPMVVAAPRFFSGALALGDVMQIWSAFGRVQDSLSWFIGNYPALATWRATTDRLTSFEAKLIQAEQSQATSAQPSQNGNQLQVTGLDLSLPDGTVLLSDQDLQVQAGEAVLVQGPSGAGKSSLFRALAGIWPYATGQVHRPADAMFIPQRPYFPDGRLRDALAYPAPAAHYDDQQLRQALVAAELASLQDQLDSVQAWSQCLSGGEQQRLAIARVLLKKPHWVFADEATSALDPATEARVYGRLLAQTQSVRGGLVSIAHRASLAVFHQRRWTFVANHPSDNHPGQRTHPASYHVSESVVDQAAEAAAAAPAR